MASDSDLSNEADLVDVLLSAACSADGSSHQDFWPLKVLLDVLTPRKISSVLDSSDFERLLGPDFAEVIRADFLRIFAILLLNDCPERTRDFIRNGVKDDDLPLPKEILRDNNTDEVSGQKDSRLNFLRTWRTTQRYGFDRTQWQFLTPYFTYRGIPTHFSFKKKQFFHG
ncbi:hypothetical protein MMC17_010069 [Xylographa soralifera]|nr:hypothetical protein [Xylographa soralifera]